MVCIHEQTTQIKMGEVNLPDVLRSAKKPGELVYGFAHKNAEKRREGAGFSAGRSAGR
jgi:hypothetical protein